MEPNTGEPMSPASLSPLRDPTAGEPLCSILHTGELNGSSLSGPKGVAEEGKRAASTREPRTAFAPPVGCTPLLPALPPSAPSPMSMPEPEGEDEGGRRR